jgi:hypothetical protein
LPNGLKGVHHASIGIFSYSVLQQEDESSSGSSYCDSYSSFFFYEQNPAIFLPQIFGLVAPMLALFGVVVQLFAKTYRPFANLLWLFAFGSQVATWGILIEPSFCFQSSVGDDEDKDYAATTCHVTVAGYSNMLAALFFLVAYVWSLTCRRKIIRRPEPPPSIIVIESPTIVQVPIGSSDTITTSDPPSVVSDDSTCTQSDIDIEMIEPQDETILDTIGGEQQLDKERQGPDEEVVDMHRRVVKELVEHKLFQEQGKKLAEEDDDHHQAAADVETADAPVYSSSDWDTVVDAPDA